MIAFKQFILFSSKINELFVQQNDFSVLLNLTNSHLSWSSSYYTFWVLVKFKLLAANLKFRQRNAGVSKLPPNNLGSQRGLRIDDSDSTNLHI